MRKYSLSGMTTSAPRLFFLVDLACGLMARFLGQRCVYRVSSTVGRCATTPFMQAQIPGSGFRLWKPGFRHSPARMSLGRRRSQSLERNKQSLSRGASLERLQGSSGRAFARLVFLFLGGFLLGCHEVFSSV